MIAKTLERSLMAVALLFLGACAASPTEKAWQTMHLIDVAQTLNGPARDACFFERDAFTRLLIGEKPSSEAVIAWGLGAGVAHYAFDRWLHDTGRAEHRGWRLLRYVDLGAKGFTIGRNHARGMRPIGDNHCPQR